jgi:hypothetical protein
VVAASFAFLPLRHGASRIRLGCLSVRPLSQGRKNRSLARYETPRLLQTTDHGAPTVAVVCRRGLDINPNTEKSLTIADVDDVIHVMTDVMRTARQPLSLLHHHPDGYAQRDLFIFIRNKIINHHHDDPLLRFD